MRTLFLSLALATLASVQAQRALLPLGANVAWDSLSLLVDGQRVVPAMGEMHFSRVPADEWGEEVRKMQQGGISILATYVFWIHHEQEEGQWTWEGERDLHRFLQVCKEAQMPVLLRIGPFCHGEVRNGGLPDWLFDKDCKLRSTDEGFLAEVRKWYAALFEQVKGLQWQDGGPVLAIQLDNEYRGSADYLLTLKQIAQEEGFDLPFYTYTGWPPLSTPMPYGEMLPLYGDYADGFWDRSTEEGVGSYGKAFRFSKPQMPTAIASEQLAPAENSLSENTLSTTYPYFTCELGGGMMPSYHRRIHTYPQDAYALAVVKLGSGSNLLGYYMYHGGINPSPVEGQQEEDAAPLPWLNENQRTPGTNYNDLPVKDYDFQAPIGASGQLRPHYYALRKLHLFLQDFGDVLAPMQPVFPASDSIPYSVRTDGKGAFVFLNTYARFDSLAALRKVHIPLPIEGEPTLKLKRVPAGTTAIFPVGIEAEGLTIQYATVQLLARRPGALYFASVRGVPAKMKINGKLLRQLRPKGENVPVATIKGVKIYLLEDEDAGHLFLPRAKAVEPLTVRYRKTAEATTTYRYISTGAHSVAEAPTDSDFLHAAVYTLTVGKRSGLLRIDYRGDCARLYTDKGELLTDHFQNGTTLDYLLPRLPKNTQSLQLRILPIQRNMPVYFPREVDTTLGEEVYSVSIERNSRPTTTQNRHSRTRKFFSKRRRKR